MDEFNEEGEVDKDVDMSTTTMDRPTEAHFWLG
jgi:hypothetical protein